MKLNFEHKNKEIEFNIIRRKRKTICIKIEENGQVIVSAPLRVSKQCILDIVQNRADWIIEKQIEIEKRGSKKVSREISGGSTFMYLGEEYPMHVIFQENRRNITVEFKNEDIDKNGLNKYVSSNIVINSENKDETFLRHGFIVYTNTMDEEKLKLALEKWYRAETLKIVTKRIAYYSSNFKDNVTEIRVKEQKRRWASCTGKNAILFNWRISMARADVIDYIVVHEMCHMDHRNHSKFFWNRVAEIMPNFRVKHEWLRVNGMNLYI
jgi:predicted metal-dependent hydrolase